MRIDPWPVGTLNIIELVLLVKVEDIKRRLLEIFDQNFRFIWFQHDDSKLGTMKKIY